MQQELDSLDAQREFAARKQSIYRDVNDRIESLADTESTAVFVCECVQDECDERIPLAIDDYEEIRSSPTRFFVLDGHHVSGVNDVVEKSDGYLVVENRAAAG